MHFGEHVLFDLMVVFVEKDGENLVESRRTRRILQLLTTSIPYGRLLLATMITVMSTIEFPFSSIPF